MQTIILFLGIFTMTATAAQLSLFRKLWQRIASMALLALGVYWFYPFAVRQSTSDLEMLLNNPLVMQNIAVLLVLEAVIMIVISLFMLRDYYTPLKGLEAMVLKLQYIPAVTAILMLGYWEIHLFQLGIDLPFGQTAMLYGGGAALALVMSSYFLRTIMKVRVLRLELKLAMHGAQLVLAIATSVLMSSYPYQGSDITPNWLAFGAFMTMLTGMVILGMWWQKRSFAKRFNF